MLAIKGAKVIATNGERVDEGYTVVVTEGVISAVGPEASTPIPPGAELVDGKDRWLIPGLMDLHVHMSGNWEEERHLCLATGITTIRNMARNEAFARA